MQMVCFYTFQIYIIIMTIISFFVFNFYFLLFSYHYFSCFYSDNLQENTHAKLWFQSSCFATLLKSHFGMDVLRTPLNDCFCTPLIHVGFFAILWKKFNHKNCVKSVRIRSFSGPYRVQMKENTDQKNFE